jgi:hypothetical protein
MRYGRAIADIRSEYWELVSGVSVAYAGGNPATALWLNEPWRAGIAGRVYLLEGGEACGTTDAKIN